MHATFRQLQLFLALAETGSVTAAARACHVTQPTVSMQLRDLADSVGLPLYSQFGKRLQLTEAGEALVRAAQSMSDEWAAFEQRINGLKGLTQGRLRISVVSTAKYFVPGILGTFCARYPDIDIALELLNRDGVLARLRDHRDDLYIMSMPPRDMDLEQEVFLPNPLVVIAAKEHPLAHRKAIPLSTIAKERFILREQGSSTRMACDAHFDCLGFHPNVRLELGSNEAIKHSVAAGLGLAVLSRHTIAGRTDGDGVVELNVQGFPAESNWFILHPKDHRPSPVVVEFLAHLRASARELTASISDAVRT
jgi:DNA-binding transcriptional LysR family regulator